MTFQNEKSGCFQNDSKSHSHLFKIDLKDRKILSELDFDARMPNSEIAKKVQLSKKGVEYRIKQLEEKRVILGYHPVINFMKLGYYYGKVYVKLLFANEEIKSKIESFVKNNSSIHWARWAEGEYDLAIGFLTKSLAGFKEIMEKFNLKFNKHIKDRNVAITIELIHLPLNLIDKEFKEMKMRETQEIEKLDNIDKKILNCLVKNSRKNSSEIAREIKSNYKTVACRIKKLIYKTILLGTRTELNYNALGIEHYKLFLYFTHEINKSPEKIQEYLKKQPETIRIVSDIGLADFDVDLAVYSHAEFLKFIENLEKQFPSLIKNYAHLVFTRTIKSSFPHF